MDPEIERTLRRQQRSALQEIVEAQGEREIIIELPLIELMAEEANRALRDFPLPGTGTGLQTSIARPTTNVNNFEIKPTLIQIVQQFQFRS